MGHEKRSGVEMVMRSRKRKRRKEGKTEVINCDWNEGSKEEVKANKQ